MFDRIEFAFRSEWVTIATRYLTVAQGEKPNMIKSIYQSAWKHFPLIYCNLFRSFVSFLPFCTHWEVDAIIMNFEYNLYASLLMINKFTRKTMLLHIVFCFCIIFHQKRATHFKKLRTTEFITTAKGIPCIMIQSRNCAAVADFSYFFCVQVVHWSWPKINMRCAVIDCLRILCDRQLRLAAAQRMLRYSPFVFIPTHPREKRSQHQLDSIKNIVYRSHGLIRFIFHMPAAMQILFEIAIKIFFSKGPVNER